MGKDGFQSPVMTSCPSWLCGAGPSPLVFLGCTSDLSLLLWAIRSLPGIQEPSGVGLEAPPFLVQDLLLLLGTSPPPQHVFKVCERAQEGVLADSKIDKSILIMF